jgi:hypothetical protein
LLGYEYFTVPITERCIDPRNQTILIWSDVHHHLLYQI